MKTFAKNTSITFISRILQLIFGIGTSIIIARILGPEGKGIYSLAILLPVLLITFSQLGIGSASVFYIGRKKYPMKEILGANIIFSILTSSFATLVGLAIIFFFGDRIFPNIAKEYLLLALLLIPCRISLNFILYILLGLQKIKEYNFIQLIQVFIFLILITIFLLGLHFGIRVTIIAGVVSCASACVILFNQTKKEIGGLVFSLNKNLFKDFFSYGGKAYVGNITTFLYLRIDMWMINIFLNPLAVGFYSIAVGLSEKIWLISQSAGTVLFPRVSSETNEKNLKEFTPIVNRNILFITILIAILLLLLARWIIVLLYSEKFLESALPFQILLIGAVALGGSRIITNDIAGRGKPMINTYIATVSVILNILLNIILIPKFGIIGASWATAISYTVTFILKIITYAKISGNPIPKIIFIQKSDIALYRNFVSALVKRARSIS